MIEPDIFKQEKETHKMNKIPVMRDAEAIYELMRTYCIQICKVICNKVHYTINYKDISSKYMS